MSENDQDEIKTDPVAPRFDLVLLEVPPVRRMRIVDVLLKLDLGQRRFTVQEALVLTFRLPSVIARGLMLGKALELETIFEVYGAQVIIRPTQKTRIEKKDSKDSS